MALKNKNLQICPFREDHQPQGLCHYAANSGVFVNREGEVAEAGAEGDTGVGDGKCGERG